MSFYKRKDIGRVYVIKIVLPCGTIVHKIGMCKSPRSTDRMMEILKSWFSQFRFVPYTELRLDKETHDPEKLEKFIHRILKPRRFYPEHKVDGGTEMFTGVDEIRLLHFLRSFNDILLAKPLRLNDSDYEHLCNLIAPLRDS